MKPDLPRLVLAGGSGFLGRALADHFIARGYEVVILTRCSGASIPLRREVQWDARTTGPWQNELEGTTVVVNLTGKSVNCRYTPKNRREILESRINSTRAIAEAIRSCKRPPRVWLNASTATIYKHTYSVPWGDDGEIGASREAKDAFSIEVAKAWESALFEADTPYTRKVALRAAMVLGSGGNSVYPVLRRLARFRLGGKMGHGRQFVSWIHERDFCRAVEWIIEHEELSGTVNLAAPNPVTNEAMMKTLRGFAG